MHYLKPFFLVAILSLAGEAWAQTQTIRAFSHRGGRQEFDENTLMAFQKSWDAGYTGFETDIRMTRDGVCYITHDNTLERTTNGTGELEKKTAAEIDKLRTKKGNKILKLDELVEFLNGKDNLYVEWELKSSPASSYPEGGRLEQYCEKVYQATKKVKTKNSQFVFTSGDYRALRYMQTHHPDAELLLIIGKPLNEQTMDIAKTVGIKTLGCTMNGTSREMVEKAHKEGFCVSLWPGTSVEDFMLGAYLGADRMCTDVPIAVKTWMEKNAPWIKVVY